ncbi:MAG: hypothetical protein HY908_28605 [Myxococcales bacterium]|nr:hypothetical protein [Myxococcales bacterium]
MRVHGDVWAFRDGPQGARLVLQDSKNGALVASAPVGAFFEVVASSAPERIVLVLGGYEHPGKVLVLDRRAHTVAEIPAPLCAP